MFGHDRDISFELANSALLPAIGPYPQQFHLFPEAQRIALALDNLANNLHAHRDEMFELQSQETNKIEQHFHNLVELPHFAFFDPAAPF